MPKVPHPRTDIDRVQWEPSSSSEEDWGNAEWEVLKISRDHVDTRGNLCFNIEWADWRRDDGSTSTWEKQDGTTMRDLIAIRRRWQRSQDRDFFQEAGSSTVSPFIPSTCCKDPVDQNETDEGKDAKSQLAFRYMFTELADQEHHMAVHMRDESNFAKSSSLISAGTRLQDLRSTRDAALHALDTSISEAPSLCLHDLGPAPQNKARYQAQRKRSLHHQMRRLHVSNPRSQRVNHLGPLALTAVKPAPQVQLSGLSPPEKESFSWSPRARGQSMSLTLSRNARPHTRKPFVEPTVRPGPPASDHIIVSEPKRRRKIPQTSTIVSSSKYSNVSVMTMSSPSPSLRDILQGKWSKAVRIAGAASVIFVDDFDTESAPVNDVNTFIYLESSFIFGFGVPQPDENFMESCECVRGCTASLCSCQDDSLLQEEDCSKAFAYDNKGFFAFRDNLRSYVVECNQKCLCGATCPSRVAQRRREFPVEVFRTERRGWGVRSGVPLPKGSVLGVYTGEVITRSRSSECDGKQGEYIFDLDFFSRQSTGKYSVDAYNCGNWTRFINHSCDPVCSVYPVVWDSPPSLHQPKLAFVANIDIPARSELTIDYNPKVRKGKAKATAMLGRPDCMCGSDNCRGFIYDNGPGSGSGH